MVTQKYFSSFLLLCKHSVSPSEEQLLMKQTHLETQLGSIPANVRNTCQLPVAQQLLKP